MTVFFIVTTLVCGIGWFKRYVACITLIYYIKKKGYKYPTDEEMKECIHYVVEHLLRKEKKR